LFQFFLVVHGKDEAREYGERCEYLKEQCIIEEVVNQHQIYQGGHSLE